MKEKTIICDLDGTLCDITHRLCFLSEKHKRWNEFYNRLLYDKPNQWCVEILKKFNRTHYIVFITGRPETYRDLTEKWLKHFKIRYDELFMRSQFDRRRDDIVKFEILNKLKKSKYKDIEFAVEDRERNVQMYRSQGVICLQCADGKF